MVKMALPKSSTRVLFLGLSLFVAICVYVLVVTHHLRMPQLDYGLSSHTHMRDKLAVDALHHLSVEEFAKYDKDGDSKLSINEFASMLHDSKQRAANQERELQRQVEERQQQSLGATLSSWFLGSGGDVGDDDEDSAVTDYDTYNEEEVHGEEVPYDEEEVDAEQEDALDDVDYDDEFGPSSTASSATAASTTASTASAVTSTVVAAAAGGGGCPELSKELVGQFARQATIMLTVADWRIFGTMGINWMKHLAKWGVDYYLVGATDEKTAQFLGQTGKHPCFKFYESSRNKGSDEYRYGDAHYNAATWRKVVVVDKIVNWGFNVIHSDVDVVWFRDPLPYFLGPELRNVDVALSSDLISTQNAPGDEGLEKGIHQHTNFNTGVYFVRSSPGGKAFMDGWAAMRSTHLNVNDQVGVYEFIRGRPAPSDGRVLALQPKQGEDKAAKELAANPGGYVRTRETDPLPVGTSIRLGGLGVHMLLNGYSYFIPHLHELMKVHPLGIHMTWVPLSKEGKFHRFRDGMLYDDPPEYYDAPDLKFLAADIDAPDAPAGFNDWKETEDMIQVHLKNMPPQLKQVYRAVAVAMALNRTLIFPRLRCFCFKNWFMSEQCRIPGDKVTQFPLDCALDQIFRPKVLYNYPPLDTRNGLQNFTFREYSMLDNPRTPAVVRNGQVLVVPEGADAGNVTGFVSVVKVKPNLMQDDLVTALEPVKDAKVLRLRHPLQLFGGFSDPVLKKSVEAFADAVTANWCCRDEPYIAKGMAKKVKMVMAW